MSTKFTAAVGISLSSLTPGSPIACRIIDVAQNTGETAQKVRSSSHQTQSLTSSVASTLQNLSIPPNAYIIVSIPLYFTSTEEGIVRDAFAEVSRSDERFSSYMIMTHENLFRRIISASQPNQPTHNELMINIGPERTVCRAVSTDTEEGVSESREIARVECASVADEIEKCVKEVKDLVGGSAEITRVLTTHLPTTESKTIVAELFERRLAGLLPQSTTEYNTTSEPETQAASEALRRLSETLICTFSMSILRLGIELEDGKVYGVIPKHVTLPQSREVDLRTTAESASVRVVVGGPKRRLILGTVKVEGVKSGAKLRVQVNVDGDMQVRMVVKEVSEKGESGKVVGEGDVGVMLGGLKDKELDEIVTKDENLEGEVDCAVGDRKLPA